VINHTFEREGTYYVNLTVRSVNQRNLGILDGTQIVPITVAPQAAIISVFANGERLDRRVHTKLGSREARNGIRFDGSATIPQGGRVILRHFWEISNTRWFRFRSREQSGVPSFVDVKLPDNGDYEIKLTVIDNENNTIDGTFLLMISDPIALITQTPEQGTTQTEFTFESRRSYSISSRIRTTTREVFDSEGNRIFTTQTPSIKRLFPRPWPYNIKLTVMDEAGSSDTQTITLTVDSTDPVAQFAIEATSEREFPSQFIFDATKSSDADMKGGVDTLTYSWNFGQSGTYVIERENEDRSQMVVSFDTVGRLPVSLTVTDSYGKTNTVEQTVDVKSWLRPIIMATPRATTRREPITFVVRTNSDAIVNIDRDFGDGTTRKTTSNIIEHTYQTVGTYTVKAKVTTRWDDINTAMLDVFVGEKDSPIGIYKVVDRLQNVMRQREECEDPTNTGTFFPAYRVDRFDEVRIDMSESVNIRGQRNNGLRYYYQPKDDEIFTRQNFVYRFDTMGCRYVDVTIEDINANKFDRRRVWFKVFNALPTVENIKLGFPQFGNDAGIGFQQNQARDILYTQFDPLTVKVEAIRPQDPDGFISYFTRYYYDRNNPDRILESKVSPSTSPYAFFSLPTTIPGEYVFGVRMTDNDGGEIASEEIIGQSAMIAFFPDSRNIDIPLVTVVPDKINIKAGDEVTFTVRTRILSNRKDFDAQRVIRYDFDGDGVIDLVTKDDVATYMYTEPIEEWVIPKVEVVYRWYKGTAFAERITILPWLRPILYTSTVGDTLIMRDLSVGNIASKEICFDRRVCQSDPNFLKTQGNLFIFTYPEPGSYVLEYRIKDDFGNEATERRVIEIAWLDRRNFVQIATIPKMETVDGRLRVRVGDNMANAVLYHVGYNNFDGWDCYLDADISIDTDADSISDNDRDIECNVPNTLIRYNPQSITSLARLYYQIPDDVNGWTKTEFLDITVEFLDQKITLSPQDKEKFDQITAIVTQIDTQIATGNQQLVDELLNLRSNIQSKLDVATSLITIADMLKRQEELGIIIAPETEEAINDLTKEFADGSIMAALGGTVYEQGKQEILAIAPPWLRQRVEQFFSRIEQIENPEVNKEQIKQQLDGLVKFLLENTTTNYETQTDDQILQEDLDLIVMPAVCDILWFFDIPSRQCATPESTATKVVEQTNSWLGTVIKWILIVLLVVWLVFGWLVSYFAIKAKQKQQA